MKSYEYMVVYAHQRGTGRICVTTEKEIENYSDVESVDEVIRERNGIETSFVTDFKLLRVYEKSDS